MLDLTYEPRACQLGACEIASPRGKFSVCLATQDLGGGTIAGCGHLVLAGNSLGNGRDIPVRSLEAMRSADLVIFESLRGGRQALKMAGVIREFLVLSEHQEMQTLEEATDRLRSGETVVYLSDQGMPSVADPGVRLSEEAVHAGARISVIPGPSCVTAAIAACPFSAVPFYFAELLPRKEEARLARLQKLKREQPQAIVLIDTPYRISQLLAACRQVFGSRQTALLALDISGEKEEFRTGCLGDLEREFKGPKNSLNFVLVLAPRSRSA